jgi:hypothetical protein
MKLLRQFALACTLAGTGYAQMPNCYQSVNSVTWLVQDIDAVKPGWIALGLSDIHEYRDVVLTGKYRGKPVKMWAWEITGHLGNLTVDMIQPAEGQLNAWNDFLGRHGDGIFSVVHEVASRAEMAKEIKRMHGLGVGVLQQLSLDREGKRVTYTYFDTEPQGKFVLGLVYWAEGAPAVGPPGEVSQLGAVIRNAESVSAYWRRLGFPPFRMEGGVGYQHFDQFTYEWVVDPGAKSEGIQRLGMPVEDLDKAIAGYEKLGYKAKGSGHRVFIDTDAMGGVSVELHPGR